MRLLLEKRLELSLTRFGEERASHVYEITIQRGPGIKEGGDTHVKVALKISISCMAGDDPSANENKRKKEHSQEGKGIKRQCAKALNRKRGWGGGTPLRDKKAQENYGTFTPGQEAGGRWHNWTQ